MHMFTASQLRQIHEEHIALYINKPNEGAKPKNKEHKGRSWIFNPFSEVK